MTTGKHQASGSRQDGMLRGKSRGGTGTEPGPQGPGPQGPGPQGPGPEGPGPVGPGPGPGGDPAASPDGAADQMVTSLYTAHYQQLVRLAVLLVHDLPTAQQIVQDAFVALHGAWRRRSGDSALSYLRQSVVSRSRSVLQCRTPVTGLADPVVIRALVALPACQREALVLNYYAGLSDAQTGAAMGISKQTAKSHLARAMTGLRAVLDQAQ